MYVLGIHNAADSGVCLIKDGVVLSAVNEERFSRKKLHLGWPDLSLEYVLKKHGISLADVDRFAYGWHGQKNDFSDYLNRFLARLQIELREAPGSLKTIQDRVNSEIARDQAIREQFDQSAAAAGIPMDRISYYDHHRSHAWAAFASSQFDESFVFTLDGRGDRKSGGAFFASSEDGLVEHDYMLSAFDGLGFLYGQITHYLGYSPQRHEGKVTGLAAFGKPERTLPLFERLISWEDDSIRAHFNLYKPFYTNLMPALIEELDRFTPEDIAAGLQAHCENLTAKYIAHWIAKIDRPDINNLCLSGGVFGNVKINQVAFEIDAVDDIFVFPHMGDGGLTMGAALLASHEMGGPAKAPLHSAYLGPEFSNDEIVHDLVEFENDISIEHAEDIVKSTIDLLVEEMVVGYFEGRMEFGPRALGARSILLHAQDATVNDWLNKRLNRTEFMPFAPVTPVHLADQCYLGWAAHDRSTWFMTRTFRCTPGFIKNHPAVSHIDGTARPQIVTRENNGRYYEVVSGYCERTGNQALINTSFNAHEEPIICAPKDAVKNLLTGGIDILVIGDFIVRTK